VVNFGKRVPKAPTRAPAAAADRPAFGGRSAREEAMGGGERAYSDRPQTARPQGAVGDLGHFQYRIYFCFDADQLAALFQCGNKVPKICIFHLRYSPVPESVS